MIIALLTAFFLAGAHDGGSMLAEQFARARDRIDVVADHDIKDRCETLLETISAEIAVAQAETDARANRFGAMMGDRSVSRSELESTLDELEAERAEWRSRVFDLRSEIRGELTDDEWTALMKP